MSAFHDVVAAATQGPAAVQEWIETHRPDITTALADAVYEESSRVLRENRDLGGRASLSLAASALYLTLGLEEKALQASFDHLQCVYLAADTAKAYEYPFNGARKIAPRARTKNLKELAFSLHVLAADCAYCIADLSNEAPDWLLRSLEDLHEAAHDAAVPIDPSRLALYVNVPPNLVGPCSRANWGGDAGAAQTLLISLAKEIERLVPVDYAFPNKPDMTAFIAERLAILSDDYGNPHVAARRRSFGARLQK
ncbi:MAG: hypothetical protein A3F70_06665 [Acidobacteria bacterium RIFCSPLOWO2_12_FULL_67_14]|nr:MAG: hypothetical protein A3H29_09340 [Acidobacteria bacterium RIFCSPLOWO2_02_FULL_67_21]OFW37305.1 MAG: hypothetical protein A3F70_06665 [Acidobacteria bacterium RIFCSPLOWO2_12_FULL_67_14]